MPGLLKKSKLYFANMILLFLHTDKVFSLGFRNRLLLKWYCLFIQIHLLLLWYAIKGIILKFISAAYNDVIFNHQRDIRAFW